MKIVRHRICREVMYANNFRKLIIKFGVYIVLLFILLLVLILPQLVEKKVVNHNARFITDMKYILIWKNSKRNKRQPVRNVASGQSLFIKQDCPFINCYITYNRSMIPTQEFDAVIFNIQELRKTSNIDFITMPRSPNQLYIFKSLESAHKRLLCDPRFDNFFNWTWTYKLDSDIPQPFIKVIDKNNVKVAPKLRPAWITEMRNDDRYINTIYGKNKAVACIINSCILKNKHSVILAELEEELKEYNYTLDTYGPCGEKKCKGDLQSCNRVIDDEYFYNLVLEDSITPDYVSDKVAKAMMRLTIPIIVGGSNLTNHLPPGSYINAYAFDIKKLVAILDYLIKDPKKYSLFFDWKSHYSVSVWSKIHVCDLCTKLNERRDERKTHKEFRKWWRSDFVNQCEVTRLHELFSTSK